MRVTQTPPRAGRFIRYERGRYVIYQIAQGQPRYFHQADNLMTARFHATK